MTTVIAIIFWFFCLPMLYLLGKAVGVGFSKRGDIVAGVSFVGLGWACFAYFLILLGLFKGGLSIAPVIAFMLAVLFFCRKGLRNFLDWVKALASFFDLRHGVGTWGWFLRIVFLFSIVSTFAVCMLPESSNDGLAYQLTLPKLFLQQSSIVPIEFEVRSFRSFLQNILYVPGLMFGNAPIAKLFHWITGALLAAGVAAIVEQKTKDRDLGTFVGVLLWLTPTLINQITTTYVDVGVTFFVFLSLYPLIGETKLRKADIFYSGLFMGIAISIKFLAVTACVSASIYLFWRMVKNRFAKDECLRLIIWGAGILTGCGFWFIRNWIYTGNPVYPYLTSWFNKESVPFPWDSDYTLAGLPRTWINYVLVLWNLTFRPGAFDYHHWIGPAYFALLPVAVYGACKERKNRPYLFLIWLMTTTWFLTARISRYLMPMFPFYMICLAFGVNQIQGRFQKGTLPSIIKSINTLLVVFLFALSLNHFRIQFLPLLRIWSVEQYLEYTERTVGIAKWVNENLPINSKILVRGEARLFYFDRKLIFEDFFTILSKYGEGRTTAQMADFLKNMGFTHLLDALSLLSGAIINRSEFDLLIEDSSVVRKVYTMVSKNGREPKSIYTVYELI